MLQHILNSSDREMKQQHHTTYQQKHILLITATWASLKPYLTLQKQLKTCTTLQKLKITTSNPKTTLNQS